MNERGAITLIFVFLISALMATGGLILNVAVTVHRKNQTQLAADAAALTAGTVMSRAMNETTKANMLLTRNLCAQAAAEAALITAAMIPYYWDQQAKACGPYYAACLAAIIAAEGAQYQYFVSEAIPTATAVVADGRFLSRAEQVCEYAHAWKDAFPDALEAHRKKLQSFYGRAFYLAQSQGESHVRLPLKGGSAADLLQALVLRWNARDRGWTHDPQFQSIKVGRAVETYMAAAHVALAAHAATFGGAHLILSTHTTTESGPTTKNERRRFSVIAAAGASATHDSVLLPGLFSLPFFVNNAQLCVAQAETYLSIDEQSGSAIKTPYRLWTAAGMNWQPRLAYLDQLSKVTTLDPGLATILAAVNVDAADMEWNKHVVNH